MQRRDVVRAVILSGTNSANLIELLEHKGITFVALGNNLINQSQTLNHDVVFSDDIQGAYDITRHLIALGHRHICFVGNTQLPWFFRCHIGYTKAMEEAGLKPHRSAIQSENDGEIGYLGTKAALAGREPVTAIFAGNDPSAHGVYKALRDSRLRIPDDISVAGCNDTVGGWLYPGLTTIREFPEQLGKSMVELLLQRIADPRGAPRSSRFPTELIKRDSCRAISSPRTPFRNASASTRLRRIRNSGVRMKPRKEFTTPRTVPLQRQSVIADAKDGRADWEPMSLGSIHLLRLQQPRESSIDPNNFEIAQSVCHGRGILGFAG